VIPHRIIKKHGIDIEGLPQLEDRAGAVCSVTQCGNVKTESHHIAPYHLFDNPNDWPQIPLCKKHHKEWHDIVTPNMTRKNKS